MAVIPARTKYRRVHRLPYEGKAKGNTKLNNGTYGLMAMEGAWITTNQIEAARVAMTRYMKRGGKVWINIFPHMPLTKKPLGEFHNISKLKYNSYFTVTVLRLPS